MKSITRVLRAVLLAGAASAVSFGAQADGKDERDRINGADWWQWAGSIPAAVNPVLDATGGACMVGQRGRTWFLAGSFGGTASRSCSVPEGVSLFFPLVNSVWADTPNACGQGASMNVAALRKEAARFVDSMKTLGATIDSRPVRHVRRLRSEVFALSLPADGLFNSPPGCVLPAGVIPRSVDDGVYAVIDDLGVGTHVLQITASDGAGFNLNVTYTLTVVPRDRP